MMSDFKGFKKGDLVVWTRNNEKGIIIETTSDSMKVFWFGYNNKCVYYAKDTTPYPLIIKLKR